MKVKLKKGELDAEFDAEKLIEKGIEQNERTWKDKFDTKHNAKKEMLELKHKQKMEIEEKNQTKKNLFQIIGEERRKAKELELEEERRREEERKKNVKIKAIVSAILGCIGVIMMIIGIALSSSSGNPDSEWGILTIIGMFHCMSIAFLWVNEPDKKRKRKR